MPRKMQTYVLNTALPMKLYKMDDFHAFDRVTLAEFSSSASVWMDKNYIDPVSGSIFIPLAMFRGTVLGLRM
jgi:hypothetical protein